MTAPEPAILRCARCGREPAHIGGVRPGEAFHWHGGCGGRVIDLAGPEAYLFRAALHARELAHALTEAHYHAEQIGEHDMNALALKIEVAQNALARWRQRRGLQEGR
jgi:hypothetical protein